MPEIVVNNENDSLKSAMELLIERKRIMREMKKLHPVLDEEKYQQLKEKANNLLEQARQKGTLTTNEIHTLALVH